MCRLPTVPRCVLQLDQICISFDKGKTTMNFIEAALLIQGSACVYSKKVGPPGCGLDAVSAGAKVCRLAGAGGRLSPVSVAPAAPPTSSSKSLPLLTQKNRMGLQ